MHWLRISSIPSTPSQGGGSLLKGDRIAPFKCQLPPLELSPLEPLLAPPASPHARTDSHG